jgi:uracil DNA glycosylase
MPQQKRYYPPVQMKFAVFDQTAYQKVEVILLHYRH